MQNTATQARALTFFALTFALSWLIWIPLVTSHYGIGPLHVPEGISSIVRLLGVLMPATSALLLSWCAGGIGAVRSLLARLIIWRVGWNWWAAAVLGQPALLIITALIYNLLGRQPAVAIVQQPAFAAFMINTTFLLLATLGEEIGWRGIASPALQQRRSARSVIYYGPDYPSKKLLLEGE
jgi:membrane protease YdiL (CAAX protease family)